MDLLAYRNDRNARIVASLWEKPLDKPDWFKFNNISEDEAEAMIYDVVGWPYVEAKEFINALNEIKAKTITVKVNSPGGDCFEGFAIMNALIQHPAKIIMKVEGLAASIASVILMAGNEVQAFSNSMIMVHNCWSWTYGNQYEMTDVVNLLKKIDDNIVDAYHTKANVGKRELVQMMKDTTWMKAKEAKDKGFVDTIIEAKAAKAAFNLSIFSNLPKELAEEPKLTERELEKAIRDVYGLSLKETKTLLARCRKGEVAATDPNIDDVEAEELNSIKATIENVKHILGGTR